MASDWHFGKAVPFHIVSSCFLHAWEAEKKHGHCHSLWVDVQIPAVKPEHGREWGKQLT